MTSKCTVGWRSVRLRSPHQPSKVGSPSLWNSIWPCESMWKYLWLSQRPWGNYMFTHEWEARMPAPNKSCPINTPPKIRTVVMMRSISYKTSQLLQRSLPGLDLRVDSPLEAHGEVSVTEEENPQCMTLTDTYYVTEEETPQWHPF